MPDEDPSEPREAAEPTEPTSADAPAARRRNPLVVVGAVALLVAVVVGGIWFQTSREGDVEEVGSTGTGGIDAVPVDEGMTFGTAGGPIVDMYVDYQCTHCAELDEVIGDEMALLAGSGDAEIVVRPVRFLSRASARGAAALYCAAEAGHAYEMHQSLLADIAGDFTPSGLTERAGAMEIDEAAFSACLTDEATTDWVGGVTAAAESDGINSVPAVFVDGTRLSDAELRSGPAFRIAVLGDGT